MSEAKVSDSLPAELINSLHAAAASQEGKYRRDSFPKKYWGGVKSEVPPSLRKRETKIGLEKSLSSASKSEIQAGIDAFSSRKSMQAAGIRNARH